MTKQMGIYDHTTGENVVRDMTAEEEAAHKLALTPKPLTQEQEELILAKATLLAKLGIDANEAKLLLT